MTRRSRPLNRDSAPHLINCAVILAKQAIHTSITRCIANWWRIELGRDCRFYGLPILRRFPGSTLRIGDHCEFRSARWANLAGINRPCVVSTMAEGATLEIGDGCGFSATIVGCSSRIILGRRVMCGANVTISDTDWHPLDWRERAVASVSSVAMAPVLIEDDVWIGMNTIVLKGVTIGARTVVGAGSVVSRSLTEGVIAAGVPAKVIRRLDVSEDPARVALEFSTQR